MGEGAAPSGGPEPQGKFRLSAVPKWVWVVGGLMIAYLTYRFWQAARSSTPTSAVDTTATGSDNSGVSPEQASYIQQEIAAQAAKDQGAFEAGLTDIGTQLTGVQSGVSAISAAQTQTQTEQQGLSDAFDKLSQQQTMTAQELATLNQQVASQHGQLTPDQLTELQTIETQLHGKAVMTNSGETSYL